MRRFLPSALILLALFFMPLRALSAEPNSTLRSLMQQREVISHFVCAHTATHFDPQLGKHMLQLASQYTRHLSERDATYILAYYKGATDNMITQAAQRYESDAIEAGKYYFALESCQELLL